MRAMAGAFLSFMTSRHMSATSGMSPARIIRRASALILPFTTASLLSGGLSALYRLVLAPLAGPPQPSPFGGLKL